MTRRLSRGAGVALVALGAVLSLLGLSLATLLVAPPLLAVGDIHPGHVGRWVEVVAEVKTVERSPAGLLLILWDPLDGAEIRAFAPTAVREAMQGRWDLVPGALVRVRGEVHLYRGALEIVIPSPRGLAVLGP